MKMIKLYRWLAIAAVVNWVGLSAFAEKVYAINGNAANFSDMRLSGGSPMGNGGSASEDLWLTVESASVWTPSQAVSLKSLRLFGSASLTIDASNFGLTVGSIDASGYSGNLVLRNVSSVPATIPSGRVYTYADVTVNNKVTVNGTLKTSGTVNLNNAENVIPTGGLLEVVDGTTTLNGAARCLTGTLTVDSGATLVSSRTDIPYYDGACTVNIYGRLELGNTRWTIKGTQCVMNLYPGAVINGEGDEFGAVDIWHTVNVKKNGSQGGTATINAKTITNYQSSECKYNVESDMTLRLTDTPKNNGSNNFTKTGAGTLDFAGNYNLPSGKTLTVQGGKITGTLQGAGTVVLNSGSFESPFTGSVSENLFTNSGWTGTVEFNNLNLAINNYTKINKYGNANSTLRLKGCVGYMNVGAATMALELVNDNTKVAYAPNDGYSDDTPLSFPVLKGNGTFKPTSNNTKELYQFKNISSFNGRIDITGTSHRVALGNTLPSGVSQNGQDGYLYLGDNLTMPLGKSIAAKGLRVGTGVNITGDANGSLMMAATAFSAKYAVSFNGVPGYVLYCDSSDSNKVKVKLDLPTLAVTDVNYRAGTNFVGGTVSATISPYDYDNGQLYAELKRGDTTVATKNIASGQTSVVFALEGADITQGSMADYELVIKYQRNDTTFNVGDSTARINAVNGTYTQGWINENAQTQYEQTGDWTNDVRENNVFKVDVEAGQNTVVFTPKSVSNGTCVELNNIMAFAAASKFDELAIDPASQASVTLVKNPDGDGYKFAIYDHATSTWSVANVDGVTPALNVNYEFVIVLNYERRSVNYSLKTNGGTIALAETGLGASARSVQRLAYSGSGTITSVYGNLMNFNLATDGENEYATVEEALQSGKAITLLWDASVALSGSKATINRGNFGLEITNANLYEIEDTDNTVTASKLYTWGVAHTHPQANLDRVDEFSAKIDKEKTLDFALTNEIDNVQYVVTNVTFNANLAKNASVSTNEAGRLVLDFTTSSTRESEIVFDPVVLVSGGNKSKLPANNEDGWQSLLATDNSEFNNGLFTFGNNVTVQFTKNIDNVKYWGVEKNFMTAENGSFTALDETVHTTLKAEMLHTLGLQTNLSELNTILSVNNEIGNYDANGTVTISGLDANKRYVLYYVANGDRNAKFNLAQNGYSGAPKVEYVLNTGTSYVECDPNTTIAAVGGNQVNKTLWVRVSNLGPNQSGNLILSIGSATVNVMALAEYRTTVNNDTSFSEDGTNIVATLWYDAIAPEVVNVLPTADGSEIEFEQETFSNANLINSGVEILFPSEPTIDTAENQVTFGNKTITLPDYYTISVENSAEKYQLNLTLKSEVAPVIDVNVEKPVESSEETFDIVIEEVRPALFYGYEYKDSLTNAEWTRMPAVRGAELNTGRKLSAEKSSTGNHRFYRLYVTDIPPATPNTAK